MTKKKTDISEYISAHDAAQILSLKFGRPISPGYIHRVRLVRKFRVNKTCLLYHRDDIEAAHIRHRSA